LCKDDQDIILSTRLAQYVLDLNQKNYEFLKDVHLKELEE
jgi:hypothetical protein